MIQQNQPLKSFSHYQIGGAARWFIEATSLDQLKFDLGKWRSMHLELPVVVLGSTTNVLIDDAGYPGLVIKNSLFGEEIISSKPNTLIRFASGGLVSTAVNSTAKRGLAGLEWAGGLPGTIGGAVFGNAGAFGGEIKDSIVEVESIDLTDLSQISRNRPQCRFGYRDSIFKNSPSEFIISATLKFKSGEPVVLKKTLQSRVDYRQEHQPLEYPSLGSTFKNVPLEMAPAETIAACKEVIKTDPSPVIPVAHLINEAGLSGKQIGGAMISPKHPNFIVNLGHSKSSDVLQLIELVKKQVSNQFGVDLQLEVLYLH